MIWNPWREIARLKSYMDAQSNEIGRLTAERDSFRSSFGDVCHEKDVLVDRLELILAEERLTSNATVRRMAKIAREALGK